MTNSQQTQPQPSLLPTAIITMVVLIGLYGLRHIAPPSIQWWAIPSCLVFGYAIPAYGWIHNHPHFLPRISRTRQVTLETLCVILVAILISGIFFFVWKQMYPTTFPQPVISTPNSQWIAYQFLYVALSEEFFFRGFLQYRLQTTKGVNITLAILLTSLLFAGSHLLITGHLFTLLTFFPSLLMGLLFWRTQCLLATVLFHGIANIWLQYLLTTLK